MIKPTREDVEIFKDYKIEDFQRWLRVGLEGYLLGDDVWAFEPLAVFIGQDEHLISDLHNIYQALPHKSKAFFRQALANIIATLEAGVANVVVFEHLLLLAGRISAGAEVLPVLPPRVGNGLFGLTENSEGVSLFDITMRTVADLAAPIHDALTCLYQLIGSRYFECAYAGTALLALCRVNPMGLADHLNLLREKLNAMFRQYEIDKTGKRRWAERILQTVGIYALVEALQDLELSFSGDEKSPSANWLLEALFDEIEMKSPLISYEIQFDGGVVIYETERPMNRCQISGNQAGFEEHAITGLPPDGRAPETPDQAPSPRWKPARPSPEHYSSRVELIKQAEANYEYVFGTSLMASAA